MKNQFLPIFTVNRSKLIQKLQSLDEVFGILATAVESDRFLTDLRQLDKPYFIDSGVFEKNPRPVYEQHNLPWYCQVNCYFEDDRWVHRAGLADRERLRQKLRAFLDRCDRFAPDYVIAPDIIGEPLLSLHLARLALEEYSRQYRPYQLISAVQVGDALYNWQIPHPSQDAHLPHYHSPKSFLAALISEYRRVGYQYIALGGLLKAEKTTPLGLKFGLSNEELDELLSWSRPDLVLGGLALTRLPILKKHQVWADSSNWIWWDSRYDRERFENWDALQSVFM